VCVHLVPEERYRSETGTNWGFPTSTNERFSSSVIEDAFAQKPLDEATAIEVISKQVTAPCNHPIQDRYTIVVISKQATASFRSCYFWIFLHHIIWLSVLLHFRWHSVNGSKLIQKSIYDLSSLYIWPHRCVLTLDIVLLSNAKTTNSFLLINLAEWCLSSRYQWLP